MSGPALESAATIQKLGAAVRKRNTTETLAELAVIRAGDDARHARKHQAAFFTVSLVLVAVYVQFRLASLPGMYPRAYEWWTSSTGRLDPAYPTPQGSNPLMTVPNMAVRVEFPAAASVQQLLMTAPSVLRNGADFLLLMATHYSKSLKGVHWNGSSDQLRFEEMPSFLPTAQGKDWNYIWHAFNATNAKNEFVNPWAGVLWASPQAMANSPAVQEYYGSPPRRGFLTALFQGGLTAVARTQATTDVSGEDMEHYLMGSKPVRLRGACGAAQRTNAMMQSGSMYACGVSLVGGMSHSTLAAKLGSEFKGPGNKAASAILVGATLAATAFGAASAKCHPGEG